MNAPFIWIIFPALIGLLLLIFRKFNTIVILVGAAISLWLGWFAWSIPLNEVLEVGTRTIKISESMTIIGREFILSNNERPVITLFYVLNAIWILGSFYSRPSRLFVPYSIIVISLLTAVIAVEPFLFAALILEVIALLSVPLLAEPGQVSRKGVLRFIVFQTLAMPFILFTSWMVTGVEAGPGDLELLTRATALLGIGLSFSLAIFPFHSWIPMVAEESQPYVASYLFIVFPMGVSIFGLGLLDRFVWLRESEILLSLLQSIGGLMVFVGGLFAAIQNHLGRVIGFASIMEIGYTLLAISIGGEQGIIIYFWLFVPRVVSYVVWAMSLSRLNNENNRNLSFSKSIGLGLKFPFSAGAIVIAIFSLSGIPLLAGFPVRLVLWKELAELSTVVAIGTIMGAIFLMLAGLRTLSILFVSPKKDFNNKGFEQDNIGDALGSINNIGEENVYIENKKLPQELQIRNTIIRIIFITFILMIVYLGLFPQNYISSIENFLNVFEHLGN